MNWPYIIAQLDDLKPWFQYGLAGVIIAYLMVRVDGRLAKIDHRLVGLQRTMLLELLSRENLSHKARNMASSELKKTGHTEDSE